MPLHVLMADCHGSFCKTAQEVINSRADLQIIAVSSFGKEAAQLAGEHHPEVALVDTRLKDMTGAKAIDLIRQASPDTRIIAFTLDPDQELVEQMQAKGISSTVSKNADLEELLAAIRTAATAEMSGSSPTSS